MTELVFDCLSVAPERYAASPTLSFKLRITETAGAEVYAIALRCQIRIEPHKRHYSADEEPLLLDLFGERHRWGETLKPIQFANVSVVVPGFEGSTEVDLQVACSYDLDVACSKYFDSLRGGEVPFILLFSGTVFTRGQHQGFAVEQVPWHKEALVRMPVATWKELMDLHFPNSGWIRLQREVLDELRRYRSEHGLPTWEQTFEHLLKEAKR